MTARSITPGPGQDGELRRLERLQVLGGLSAPEGDRLLELRAVELARPLVELDGRGQGDDLVAFRVGRSGFLVPAEAVAEVRETGALAPLPGAPSHVLGVAAVRGRLAGIVDLASLLSGAAPAEAHPPPRLVILEWDRGYLALACEELRGLKRMRADELAPPPIAVAKEVLDCLVGVDPEGDALLAVPSLFRLLSSS